MRKKKEPWGERKGEGGDCLYSNLTRCHYTKGEETHTVPHPACQGSAR